MKRNILKKVFIICIAIGFAASAFAGGSVPDTYTKTKYPIVLVPGVLGFDSLLGVVDYFNGIESAIEKSSNGQQVHLIALSGWQDTEARGLDLKEKIEQLCRKYNYAKVNIIAHSHGSTTSRVAMKLNPGRIASLTTIAGPHYGTPTADCGASMPSILQNAAYSAINLLMGDLVAALSSHPEYVGTNDTAAVINDFTQQGMKLFNAKYPCAGVPKGGSYGTKKYGADATSPGAKAGDVYGNALPVTDPNAIRFYSWTGSVLLPATSLIPDVVDLAMTATDALNKLYLYFGKTDAFIPATSARFGEMICDSYYWNHGDEINQSFGLLAPLAADPKEVFRTHANRLQLAGL